jgi:FtsP/CotA-like multicopper oxidase with cupredoxin domain
MFQRSQVLAADSPFLSLEMVDVYHEMVDGQLIYSWAFAAQGMEGMMMPSIPGPVIFATEGDIITLNITNRLDEPHSFAIKGNNHTPFVVNSPPIPGGESRDVTFTVPAPGTYIYQDLVNAPVGRVLGLHGVLAVMPSKPFADHDTPYGRLDGINNPVQMLFDDLGHMPWFPGDCWRPERQIFWIFSELDPRYNQMAERGETINPADMLQNYMPSYFFINGRTGYFAAFDHEHHYHHSGMMAKPIPPADGFIPAQGFDTCLMAYQGEPILIRNVHVGLDTHSPHTHANHCYMLAKDGELLTDSREGTCWWVDTWTMLPEERMDLIFPMIMPPDIPFAMPTDLPVGETQIGLPSDLAGYDIWEKLKNGTSQEGFGPGEESHWNVAHPGPGFPMAWPMHSHQEISQTAAGGNYPQGLITHIEILGDFAKKNSPM